MKITSTSTNSNAESAEVTEPRTPSTAEMTELELMLPVIDWMSDWLIPKPASQVSKFVISCWICVEYSGNRVASWATPMTSPKISPSRIAKMTMTAVGRCGERGVRQVERRNQGQTRQPAGRPVPDHPAPDRIHGDGEHDRQEDRRQDARHLVDSGGHDDRGGQTQNDDQTAGQAGRHTPGVRRRGE